MKILMALMLLVSVNSFAGNETKQKAKQTSNNAKMEMTSHSKLDDLIRGELAAIKTYDQVIEKVEGKKEVEQLKSIRKDHQNAVDKLRKHANTAVKQDAKDSGAWGAFAKAWTGGAKTMGKETAIKALKQGEEHGINEYQELLEEEKISEEVKELVRTELLPNQKKHLETLNKLI